MEGPALLQPVLLATLAGFAIPLGGLLALIQPFHNSWIGSEFRHSIMAFGAGILMAAVALVLVPRGMEALPLALVISTFVGGGLIFLLIDRWLAGKGGSTSQLMALLLDFVPEAMALGALFTDQHETAVLLSLLITFQNLPEAFNAYCEIRATSKLRSWKLIGIFLLIALLGPLSALLGMQLLAEAEAWLGGIMLMASGGILYLIFQDISPQVPLAKHWAPPLGAVGGFLVGIIGHMVVQG
jgi:ZIP family zinc transporter